MKNQLVNINPETLKALRADLQFAWQTRNNCCDVVNGELVEYEETDAMKRLQNSDSFFRGIDPENMAALKHIFRQLPGNYTMNHAAREIKDGEINAF